MIPFKKWWDVTKTPLVDPELLYRVLLRLPETLTAFQLLKN